MDERRPIIEPSGDNRDAIQSCLDEAHRAGGGTVELASGSCPIGAPLELRSNVTLRGAGMIATVLRPTGYTGPAVLSATELRGATLEELTIAGGSVDAVTTTSTSTEPNGASVGRSDGPGHAAVDLGAGASFCFLRRLRLTDLPDGAVRVAGGSIDHLYLEHLVIEGCGGDGIVLRPEGEAEGIFVTEVSVRSFGRAGEPGVAGVRASGRAFISQLHVQPVETGAVGLALEPGSEHTVASNLFFGVAGGQARTVAAGPGGVSIEAELVRDLSDQRLARTFP